MPMTQEKNVAGGAIDHSIHNMHGLSEMCL